MNNVESGMTIFFLAFVGLGLLAMFVGGIMTLVAAFRQSLLWGFAYLFVPFASLVFLFKHWAEAKMGFFISLIGLAIFVVPIVGRSDVRGGFIKELQARATNAPPAPDLTAQIAAQRGRIEQMEGQFAQTNVQLTQRYRALAATRQALKPGDNEAITRYNTEAAAYQTETTALRQRQQEIATAHKALDALLAERSKKAAATGSAAGARQVVMYTTAQCPACVQAKQYFAQRGVSYEERNVQQSKTAAEEFQRLGGRGVPLIMVGEKRVDGFNLQALDQMLGAASS